MVKSWAVAELKKIKNKQVDLLIKQHLDAEVLYLLQNQILERLKGLQDKSDNIPFIPG